MAQKATAALQPSQIGELSHVLSRAFWDDPLTLYFMPDEDKRKKALPWFFQKAAQISTRYGEPFTTSGKVEAGALWLPPGKTILTMGQMFRVGMLAAPFKFGPGPFMRFLSAMNTMEHLHKRDVPPDHWYLFVLGVEPACQGRGVGGRVIAPVLERADQNRLPCYLETTKERNVAFYRKHGFEVVVDGTFKDGPRYWTMKRDPIG
jgi:ribosomal protein S18 acetylase RimI-like enzyme